MNDKDYLQLGLSRCARVLEPAQIEQLLAYMALMQKWNQVYNLTRITEPTEIIDKHLLDSLLIADLMIGKRHLDVGSGAGLPGIPLAITHPHWEITCLDSNIKKARFMRQVKAELKLSNLSVVHSRLEDYLPAVGFDMVLSRAFKSVVATVEICAHLDFQQLLLMKGVLPEQELQALSDDWQSQVTTLEHPQFRDARHAIIIERTIT